MADLWLTHKPYIKRQSWPRNGLAFWPSGRQKAKPRLIVNHSTETLGFPSYNGGAAAPHFTINLETGEVRQHIPLNWGSRCLAVSTGGVTDRTVNISGTIQIEVIGAVTPGYPRTYGHYDLVNRFPKDERAQRYLARLWRDISEATGIPLQLSSYGYWKTYPSSYGVRASQRLSSAQFRDAVGILGHQHAVANDHGDGLYGRALSGVPVDIEKVIALAKSGAATLPGSRPDPRKGFTQEHLDEISAALGMLGYTGDVWARTLAYQKAYGLDPEDGLPGPQTTEHLEETMARLERKIDALADAVERLHDATDVAEAIARRASQGLSGDYWQRLGAVPNPNHPAFPADLGSLADHILRASAARSEDGVTSIYAGNEHGTVKIRVNPETDEWERV